MTKIVLCLAFFVPVTVSAQDATLEKRAQTLASQIVSDVVVRFNSQNVKGAPYSAEAVNETVQVLGDGNRITRSNSTVLYRDSEGRERREESSSLGAREPIRSITISDPVEGVTYSMRPADKTARKVAMRRSSSAPDFVPLTVSDIIHAPVSPVMITATQSDSELHYTKIDSNEEDLGTQMMEGVLVKGTRITTTVPVGAVGNERPIVTVNERWYSPELQILVMSTRSDPRTGTTTYKVTNIDRSEQPRTLFEPPADYKVVDLTGNKPTGAKPEEQ